MAMANSQSLLKLRDYVEGQQFEGYDPYDALNSPLLRGLSLGKKGMRILFIQSLKRLPINIRPLLGIRKGLNPKGIGLFIWGYAKLYALQGQPEYLKIQDRLLQFLEETRSQGYSGRSWGYNFDWQSRAFFLPKYTPTIVNTSFIGHALLDSYIHTGNEQSLSMAISAKDFIIRSLNRKSEGPFFCFSYSPLDECYVHNANLLGASLLIRLFLYTGESILKDTALASLGYSMKHQREDGSWPYAETDYQSWIDSFHTGFNLQSIWYFLQAGYGQPYREALARGLKFYEENFFLADGTPKYYNNRLFPIDIHSAAQAVVVFCLLGRSHRQPAEKVARWMIENFQDRKGYFYFQKNRLWQNKIPYMRWAQAWAFHALTEIASGEKGSLS
jgi:hypothetical protein